MRHPRLLAAVVLVAATLLPATPALAGPAPVPTSDFRAQIGDCAASGYAERLPGTTLIVEHRRADGTLAKKHTLTADNGDWAWTCPGPAIAMGDRFRFRLPGQSAPFRVFTVPKLTLTPDRVTGVVRGKVPVTALGSDLAMYTCDPSGSSCPIDLTIQLDLGAKGTFSEPLAPVYGGHVFALTWRRGFDRIGLVRQSGWVEVRPGSAKVIGWGGVPGSTVTVTLRRGTKVVRATTTISVRGRSVVTLRANGKLVKAQVGDRITSTVGAAAKLTVPLWNSYATDTTVNGRCFPANFAQFRHYDADGTLLSTQVAPTDGEFGTWSAPETVGVGDRIDWWCTDVDGDVMRGSYPAAW